MILVIIFSSRCRRLRSAQSGAWGSDRPSFPPSAQAPETLRLRRHRQRRCEQLRHPQQRVDPDSERGEEVDLVPAVELHLAQRPPVLAPAKALLDALADPLTGQVTAMARGALIDGRVTLLGAVHRYLRGEGAFA